MTAPSGTAHLYFTSWQFVRTGGFVWVNPDGQPLGLFDAACDAGARFVYDAPRGVRLVAQPPTTRLKFDDPLGIDPAGAPGACTILHEGDRYKCWYTFLPSPPVPRDGDQPWHGHNHHLCYAESADGFHWTKPKLGLVKYAGRRDNNIVFTPFTGGPQQGMAWQSIFRDDHGDPAERYKMVYFARFTPAELDGYRRASSAAVDPMAVSTDGWAWGLAGAVSPDGIQWQRLATPLLIHHCDTLNSVTYDARRKEYVCYLRTWVLEPGSPGSFGTIGKRSIARSTSSDFRHWSTPEVILTTGADMSPSHVWYGPGHSWLPGCDDQQVMFPFRWKLEDDTMDIALYSTPDGQTWSPVSGGPVLASGTPGTWDGGYVMTGPPLVELPGDRWALPYVGFPIPHKYPRLDPAQRERHPGVASGRGYAIWPRGRLVALEAAEDGAFATVAVFPRGERLFLNAVVAADGFIKVGVDRPGREIENCVPLSGVDGLELPVAWRNETGLATKGGPVALKFQLRRAKLFGLTFQYERSKRLEER